MAIRPNTNLVSLPVVERVNNRARPWRAGVSTFSAAALLAVIVVGALLGGWLSLGDDRDRAGTGAVLPAAITSPSSAIASTPVMVFTLSGNVLFNEPSSESTAFGL